MKEDPAIRKEILRKAREVELKKIEENKEWCSNCEKKVFTVDKNHKYYDDGWMEEVDIVCSQCGTLIEHYRRQIR